MPITSNFAEPNPLIPTSARSYEPGSAERAAISRALSEILNADYEVPNIIDGKEIRTFEPRKLQVPHNHSINIGTYYSGSQQILGQAISNAVDTSKTWGNLSISERVQPFLRAAQMLENTSWRDRLVAATMLELSKTHSQADGDAACETIDLIKANFKNLIEITKSQPNSTSNVKNELEYRPLEGFVFAVSPFNFTSMSHLAFGPALLGNTVVWKPAENATLVSYLSLQLLMEAGLPDGVINLILGRGSELGPLALSHKNLAAVSFTGSTNTFNGIYKTIGENIENYSNYPRIVGETGGKGFVLVHPSADVDQVVNGAVKGAFEYQGQKCSAAARMYVPGSLWPQIKEKLIDQTKNLVLGDPTSPETFLGAVISQKQFSYHCEVIQQAKEKADVLVGGACDSSLGWFVSPTIIQTTDAKSRFMTEEFFGPILSVFVYEDSQWNAVMELTDNSTPYGLAGSIFALDENAIADALSHLKYTAGNITINDKPTGATVGQQPFGGARASGTNDKVGTIWHLSRFLSPRTIKRFYS